MLSERRYENMAVGLRARINFHVSDSQLQKGLCRGEQRPFVFFCADTIRRLLLPLFPEAPRAIRRVYSIETANPQDFPERNEYPTHKRYTRPGKFDDSGSNTSNTDPRLSHACQNDWPRMNRPSECPTLRAMLEPRTGQFIEREYSQWPRPSTHATGLRNSNDRHRCRDAPNVAAGTST